MPKSVRLLSTDEVAQLQRAVEKAQIAAPDTNSVVASELRVAIERRWRASTTSSDASSAYLKGEQAGRREALRIAADVLTAAAGRLQGQI